MSYTRPAIPSEQAITALMSSFQTQDPSIDSKQTFLATKTPQQVTAIFTEVIDKHEPYFHIAIEYLALYFSPVEKEQKQLFVSLPQAPLPSPVDASLISTVSISGTTTQETTVNEILDSTEESSEAFSFRVLNEICDLISTPRFNNTKEHHSFAEQILSLLIQNPSITKNQEIKEILALIADGEPVKNIPQTFRNILKEAFEQAFDTAITPTTTQNKKPLVNFAEDTLQLISELKTEDDTSSEVAEENFSPESLRKKRIREKLREQYVSETDDILKINYTLHTPHLINLEQIIRHKDYRHILENNEISNQLFRFANLLKKRHSELASLDNRIQILKQIPNISLDKIQALENEKQNCKNKFNQLITEYINSFGQIIQHQALQQEAKSNSANKPQFVNNHLTTFQNLIYEIGSFLHGQYLFEKNNIDAFSLKEEKTIAPTIEAALETKKSDEKQPAAPAETEEEKKIPQAARNKTKTSVPIATSSLSAVDEEEEEVLHPSNPSTVRNQSQGVSLAELLAEQPTALPDQPSMPNNLLIDIRNFSKEKLHHIDLPENKNQPLGRVTAHRVSSKLRDEIKEFSHQKLKKIPSPKPKSERPQHAAVVVATELSLAAQLKEEVVDQLEIKNPPASSVATITLAFNSGAPTSISRPLEQPPHLLVRHVEPELQLVPNQNQYELKEDTKQNKSEEKIQIEQLRMDIHELFRRAEELSSQHMKKEIDIAEHEVLNAPTVVSQEMKHAENQIRSICKFYGNASESKNITIAAPLPLTGSTAAQLNQFLKIKIGLIRDIEAYIKKNSVREFSNHLADYFKKLCLNNLSTALGKDALLKSIYDLQIFLNDHRHCHFSENKRKVILSNLIKAQQLDQKKETRDYQAIKDNVALLIRDLHEDTNALLKLPSQLEALNPGKKILSSASLTLNRLLKITPDNHVKNKILALLKTINPKLDNSPEQIEVIMKHTIELTQEFLQGFLNADAKQLSSHYNAKQFLSNVISAKQECDHSLLDAKDDKSIIKLLIHLKMDYITFANKFIDIVAIPEVRANKQALFIKDMPSLSQLKMLNMRQGMALITEFYKEVFIAANVDNRLVNKITDLHDDILRLNFNSNRDSKFSDVEEKFNQDFYKLKKRIMKLYEIKDIIITHDGRLHVSYKTAHESIRHEILKLALSGLEKLKTIHSEPEKKRYTENRIKENMRFILKLNLTDGKDIKSLYEIQNAICLNPKVWFMQSFADIKSPHQSIFSDYRVKKENKKSAKDTLRSWLQSSTTPSSLPAPQ